MDAKFNADALKSEIISSVVTRKANACPMVVRLAWHASGTFDKNDMTGGSNGAGMRFEPESKDDANSGLGIVRDMLNPVVQKHPEVSVSDIWTLAGAAAVEFMGGPKVPHKFGRSDFKDGARCPPHGRLPDAAQGADHIRDVFYRMGFNDQEIVALIGAHTLGNCHRVRSGYEGPWTRNPLKFDNTYFKNLLFLNWRPKKWDGPLQYEDDSGELMMLPADMALKTDPQFRVHVERYAKDEALFFQDFAAAFAKLMSLGCPASAQPFKFTRTQQSPRDQAGAKFREAAMHGSLLVMQQLSSQCDVHAVEASSGRTALHKAAFWGHDQAVEYLLKTLRLDPNVLDYNGDTALHDAARFGHSRVVELLLAAGANPSIRNKQGRDAAAEAAANEKQDVLATIGARSRL